MMQKSVVVIGGGGHCRSVLSILKELKSHKIIGYVDKVKLENFTLPYLGNDSILADHIDAETDFVIGIGQIERADIRIRIFDQLLKLNAQILTIISPDSFVDSFSNVGQGSVVMRKAMLNMNSSVGVNCIINTSAIIEHDVDIGDHCHVSTAAVLNGGVSIGNRCFIGSNSTILQGLRIIDDVIIGAGSVVVSNINEAGTYIGNPAKKIR